LPNHLAVGIERHRNAEALPAAEERTRFALEAAGVGIWDLDHTSGVLRWSPLLEAQYGLPPGTFGGRFEAFIALIHPDDQQPVRETPDLRGSRPAPYNPHHLRHVPGTQHAAWPL
jgi:PAS domain-containing protein